MWSIKFHLPELTGCSSSLRNLVPCPLHPNVGRNPEIRNALIALGHSIRVFRAPPCHPPRSQPQRKFYRRYFELSESYFASHHCKTSFQILHISGLFPRAPFSFKLCVCGSLSKILLYNKVRSDERCLCSSTPNLPLLLTCSHIYGFSLNDRRTISLNVSLF